MALDQDSPLEFGSHDYLPATQYRTEAVNIYDGSALQFMPASGLVTPLQGAGAGFFCGFSLEQLLLAGTTAGEQLCEVQTTGTLFLPESELEGGNGHLSVGKPVYMPDDQTFTLTSSGISAKCIGGVYSYIENIGGVGKFILWFQGHQARFPDTAWAQAITP